MTAIKPPPGIERRLSGGTRRWLASPPAGQIVGGREEEGRGVVVEDSDPGSMHPLAQFAAADRIGVDDAVRVARAAFEDGHWSHADAADRERILHSIADLLDRDRQMFSELETLDTGKPLAQASDDIAEAIAVLRYFAGWATKAEGSVVPAPGGLLSYTTREPLGVCGAITPWNYPLPILTYKLGPALAMGNSLVAKPSELAPLSTLALCRLALEAGLPPGVFNVITGAAATGAALAEHAGIDKIAFTGSTQTGRRVMEGAAKVLTRLSLELGGKSAHIVFADADLDAAADSVMAGIWTNAGQVCIAGSRLLIERPIHDEFVDLLVERTSALVLEHGLDPSADIGPLISAQQVARAQAYIATAQAEGATLACGGQAPRRPGNYLEPTVLTDVRAGTTVEQEEIFGPVLAVTAFSSDAEAIGRANDTPYGLAAGVWTSDVGRAHRVSRDLHAGSVWINTYGIFHPTMPFGGVRGSGFGRELGSDAVNQYSETKTTTLDTQV